MQINTLKISLLLLLLFCGIFSRAQENVKINICNTRTEIPFDNRLVNPTDFTLPVKLGFLPAVSKSKAEAEIRIYDVAGNYGTLAIYQFYRDSVKMVLYDYLLALNDKRSEKLISPKYSFIGTEKSQRVYIKTKSKSLLKGAKSCEYLKEIISHRIGVLPDGTQIDKLLIENKANKYRYESLSYLEFKIGEHVRNITLPQIDYGNDENVESHITYLKDLKKIREILYKIQNETKF